MIQFSLELETRDLAGKVSWLRLFRWWNTEGNSQWAWWCKFVRGRFHGGLGGADHWTVGGGWGSLDRPWWVLQRCMDLVLWDVWVCVLKLTENKMTTLTLSQWTTQEHWAHSQCCATITTVSLLNVFITPKETPHPLAIATHFPLPASPWQSLICFLSQSVCLLWIYPRGLYMVRVVICSYLHYRKITICNEGADLEGARKWIRRLAVQEAHRTDGEKGKERRDVGVEAIQLVIIRYKD